VGITSIHLTAKQIAEFGAPRLIPAALANKGLVDELD
jgi:hypothetical protein